jgi:hypothetical protein
VQHDHRVIEGRAGPADASWCDGAAGEAAMQSKLIIEIRAAEGGEDAKSLVGEQRDLYLKAAQRYCL